ncbi:hypothetical protein [Qaidamihabitans albus]|uniref:hypothetical protein n=1 Tax=Qaidamihabitans albus TaxID=2795733 RepID=UPI0018F1B727|nr:hypothetical protein [Qaidamihabitans albus]
MPIRTHRGRAAVYRRLWGWPLRSPTHLAGTLIVLTALVVSVGIVVPKVFGEPGGTTGSAASSTSSTSATAFDGGPLTSRSSLPTRLSEPRESPTSAAPDPAALRVAGEWAAAWVNHPAGSTNEQWLDRLRPLTTEEYLPVMKSVNPGNIPATKVTGEPEATESYTSSVKAEVPTDGPRLSITVVETDAGWRVAHYGEAE